MEFLTERLYIRPFLQDDREGMINLLTDETVKQTYMLPDFASRADAGKLFDRLYGLSRMDGRFVSAICMGENCIGMVNDTEISGDTIELGYAILPIYHNRGYCTEMLRGAIHYLHCHGFSKVLTAAFESNKASLRVMEKCGMRRLEKTEEVCYRGATYCCIYCCAEREGSV